MSILVLTLGSVMLLAAQNDTRASRPIWVDAPSQIGCPDEGALLAALRARLGRERVRVGRALAQDLSLRLVAHGPRALTMVLREGSSTIVERDVEVAEGECTALAHTIALIAESWLAAPQPRPRAKSRAADPEQTKPVPSSPEGTVTLGIKTGTVGADPDHATSSTPTTVLIEEAAPTSAPAPANAIPPSATPTRAADTTVTVPAVPAAAVSAADPGKVAASTSRETALAAVQPTIPAGLQDRTWSITIVASAGAMVPVDGPASWAAAGVLDLQLGYRRWFLGVRSAFESTSDLHPSAGNLVAGAPVSTALPSSGRVAVRYIPIGAYVGRALADSGRFAVAALAGGGVDLLLTQASGYSDNRSYKAIDPMAFAGLLGEWRFTGRFGLVATSNVALDFRRYQFSVANASAVARAPRVRAGFTLGVAWHLR